MDLFTSLTEDFTVAEDIDQQVKRVCAFVKNLTPQQLKLIKATQKSREFEAWEKAARNMQSFAYAQELRKDWWRIVELVKEELKGGFWTPGWDAAFDYSLATLLKPWAGKTWSSKEYELLTAPLENAGFKL